MFIRKLYHSFFSPPSSTAIVYFLQNIRATTTICHPDDILSIYTLYLPDENRLSGGKLLIFVTRSPGPGDCELWIRVTSLFRSSCDEYNPAFDLKIHLIWLKSRVNGSGERPLIWILSGALTQSSKKQRYELKSVDFCLSFGLIFDPVSQLLRQNSKNCLGDP